MSQVTSQRMEDFLDARLRRQRLELFVRIGALVLAAGLVVAAGALIPPLNAVRKEKQIALDAASVKGLPPDIALMTKLGTLRALAINVAFIRMEELKQDNRYFELMQLSDWLCKLAPTYPAVWSYSAWNMAYNISVSQYTPDARWLWVSNGIDNLRLQGLVYNPRSIKLYRELAWTFYHKVGDVLDDYHFAYKLQLAVQMESILGEPPLNVTGEEAVAAIREIAESPHDWRSPEELRERHPDLAPLLDDLQAVELSPDWDLLRFVARYMRKHSDVMVLTPAQIAAARQNEPTTNLRTRRLVVLRDPDYAAAVRKLLATVRSHVLRKELNMDAGWMLQLMENPPWAERMTNKLCPIDWRLPWAHALYWATYGDIHCKGSMFDDPADSMNTVRLVFFCLKGFSYNGNVVLEPDFDQPLRSFLQPSTDTQFFRHMHEAYLKYGKEQFGMDPEYVEGTSGPNFAAGHRNFLHDAIQLLYLEGGDDKIAEALEYFYYLRHTDLELDGSEKERYNTTLEEFVFGNIKETLDTQRGAMALINQLLLRSLEDLEKGLVAKSVAHFRTARKWWDYYMRDLATDRNERRKLEPIGTMRKVVAQGYFENPRYSALQKYRLWSALDLLTRQAIYDEVRPEIEQQAAVYDPPLDPEKILPLPPGMEDFRANLTERLKRLERFDPTVSQGEKSPD